MIKDINPSGNASPAFLTAVGSNLYFSAIDTVHGQELWKSNGAPGGTTLLGDINPGAGSSNPSYLAKVGTRLYFVADDGVSGDELWSYVP